MARRAAGCIALAAPVALTALAGPELALATDDPVTGATVSTAVTETGPLTAPGPETGPVLLLLVAGTLGLLGALSGPEPVSTSRPLHRRREPGR